jgi:outer membrane lipoprotein SlyB
MKGRSSVLMVSLLAAVSVCGCARQISSNVYSAASVGEVSKTVPGVIISARTVTVEDAEYLGDNTLGILGGGAAGALIGSRVGKGSGNTLATIAGGVGGAVAGAFAEKALKTQNAYEYIVALDNGDSKTVVQGLDPAFAVGQKVWLIESMQGRSRVTARQ